MSDAAALRRLLASGQLDEAARGALERVIPRLQLEEDVERSRRAEDDTQRLGPQPAR